MRASSPAAEVAALLVTVLLAFGSIALAAAEPSRPATGALLQEATAPARSTVDPAAAAAWLAGVLPSAELQRTLDRHLAEIGRDDSRFLEAGLRVAVIDLNSDPPRLASRRGDDPVYPASVVKFVYLMAAYAWQEQGRLTIDPGLDAQLSAMIRESSNGATQKVFSRLTGTEPGPELDAAGYAEFRRRRLLVEDWLRSFGLRRLHAVNPTYDGGGDLYGRDRQFLRDRGVEGGLASSGDEYPNRQAMTADDTARLLALLATDRALSGDDSRRVRERMKRDLREQPHLAHRIAGGAAAFGAAEAFSKSGTWGPIYADAGIVRDAPGRQFAIAVFTDASPPYRGDGIARLTRKMGEHLFRHDREGGPS